MAEPRIQNEPASVEGFHPDADEGIDPDEEGAQEDPPKKKRGPVAPRLRRDLFGNTGGIR